MKAFTSAAILSILAFSSTTIAVPAQPNNELMNLFGRNAQCHNGEGSFVKTECEKMCLIPAAGQPQQQNEKRVVPNPTAGMPKATPGVCNGVPVSIEKAITMTYETKVPGASGRPKMQKVTTTISGGAQAKPTLFLCSGCQEAKRGTQPNQKRTPNPPA
ncbi:MAG: hypothetical protein Q9160_004443 [Pyrenula sp. 1 TL-2023]